MTDDMTDDEKSAWLLAGSPDLSDPLMAQIYNHGLVLESQSQAAINPPLPIREENKNTDA